MATISYKNRTSTDYRFTVQSLDDPALLALKQMITNNNKLTYRYNKRVREGFSKFHTKFHHAQRVIIRARGPRPSMARDTPRANAVKYDVYVNARYIYE